MISFCWITFGFGLKDKTDFAKVTAVRSLGRIGTREAIELIATGDYKWKPTLIRTVTSTLAQISDSASFRALLYFGRTNDLVARENVVVGIARMNSLYPDSMVARILRKMLVDVDSTIADTLLYSKEEIEHERARLKTHIAIALSRVHDASARSYLAGMDVNPDWVFRSSVVKTIGELNPPGATEMLSRFLSDSSVYVRTRTLEALAKIRPENLAAILSEKMQTDPSEGVRIQAAIELMPLEEATAVRFLLPLADGYDEDSQSKILLALGDTQDSSLYPSIIEKALPLASHPQELVRLSAVACLGGMRDTSLIPVFRNALGDKSQEVRELAVGILARLRGTAMFEQLRTLARDEIYSMRAVAISGLGTFEDSTFLYQKALPIIVDRMKNDEDILVRIRAAFTTFDVLNDQQFTKPKKQEIDYEAIN